ncbi:hypothetical protein ACFOOM_13910 [Streptomyces echinoruber]|uniref:Uncharacterized protein n=1 Tax=Streptomyces echinoruber TaxID=68898 RepID=A0A918REP2_9ACTN|nr:hypothetical protein [Streptomyces echinoruber]GGZ95124.1 hypothetical protein GCM10010389_37560 [Streptomyces echinoruber]
MIPSIASRIPLVRRAKKPALPLDDRITLLDRLAVEPAGASHRDLVARACGVLNYAALIASDVGMPDLAADLSWRQHGVFAEAGNLSGDITVMSLMPLINISRLLTREGDGEAAYDVLTRLYRAAQKRSTAEVRGHTVDLSKLIDTEADHRRICQELWVTVLVDGARALARIGRWTEAAEALTAHRGVGNRLLDGRQIQIMSLMERGLDQQARDTIEATTPKEPWENTVAAFLCIYCRPAADPVPEAELDLALQGALALITSPDPEVTAFQARVGLTALELAPDHTSPHAARLRDALADVASHDAYAAREVLDHHATRPHLTDDQRHRLDVLLTASGLGAGNLPQAHMHALSEAVDKAEAALRELLNGQETAGVTPSAVTPSIGARHQAR